ncbi:MAG: alanine/ornithine racemase family PLP-dependent enzyme [Cytophagales bacterium]|nr:alanine/ornithine racemase family PLP-dependent enzyme [Cytophagales bacterium]
MAYITLYKHKLQHNYEFLRALFAENGMKWGIVSKLLCGNEDYLRLLMSLGTDEVHDSRISNLRKVKEINPQAYTVYIKPPASEVVAEVVQYADVSMNTEYYTLKLLSDEAQRQGKVHHAIIMIETGDLREGVMGDNLVNFYAKVFELPHIKILGLGTNLNCLHGVLPSQDKLIQLSLYKQIIELKFNREIPLVSGGTSVTIPLLLHKQVPKGVNHFRVGETLFFGTNLFDDSLIPGMTNDVFELFAQIIEITKKPMTPSGDLGHNVAGEKTEIDPALFGQSSFRAILDLGLLDIDPQYLILDTDVHPFEVVGASSDMIVLDLGQNQAGFKVGDFIPFQLKYMGALSLMNSNYVEKKVEEG